MIPGGIIANPRLPALLKCIGTTCGGNAAVAPDVTPGTISRQPQKETV
jgi:hypothetical protein